MLILRAYVNEKHIDEIHIWNTGEKIKDSEDEYIYKILRPFGYKRIEIKHKRSEGWRKLANKALEVLNTEVPKNA